RGTAKPEPHPFPFLLLPPFFAWQSVCLHEADAATISLPFPPFSIFSPPRHRHPNHPFSFSSPSFSRRSTTAGVLSVISS
uniref:Uncharacterized protein n=1 Tax=Cucumis melo TaxID=3656 RepID=A0A9I9E3H8_CUCME